MNYQDQSMSNSMQPPQSPSIPIDPSLSLYSPYYPYPQQQQHHLSSHRPLLPNYSSPSSQGSEALGTPPTEQMSFQSSNTNGKRPSSVVNGNGGDRRKKARKVDDDDAQSPAAEKEETKAKPTRGSRACTVCRRLKMKCVGAEEGPPCKRCLAGNHECIFEESNRGKRSSKSAEKHELLTRSLRKMERTLDTVLRSIGNPTIASGMVSRSPSPSAQTAGTQALLASPTPPPASTSFQPNYRPTGSPKLHSLPDNSLNPLGLLAEASLANRRAQVNSLDFSNALQARPVDTQARKLGVASDNYFKPGPMTILPLRRLYIERQVQPEMLSFVGTEDVVALFNIYFDHMNMHTHVLDGEFHTPALVCSRSPFLLTTICAISSKFYTAKPELHSRLTDIAKKLAFSVPAQGYKSVEIVQAYLLLSLWGCGAVERYEQDKTWLLLGMAIRMAIDLNLHRKTAVRSQDTDEGRARDKEVHNRERTWIICFCLDRSFSAQMGKPHSIKEDYIIRNVDKWFNSPVAISTDKSVGAYVDLQRILSRCLDLLYSGITTPSGLQVDCDYLLIIKTVETQLLTWSYDWNLARNLEMPDNVLQYKKLISQFYFNYAMLVLNSFGLQNALERSPVDIGHFFTRCYSSAMACAKLVRDELGPRGYLRYSPDSHFVQTSYAVLSLLKLVRPEFRAFLEDEQSIITLVNDVADVLESVAANQHHTPALYSAFLRVLVSKRKDGGESGAASQVYGGDSTVDSGLTPLGSFTTSLGHGINGEMPLVLDDVHFESEMGPVVDMSTFPPTMASPEDNSMGLLSMDNILSSAFWDSVVVPGYSNSMEGLSGGFVFGHGGSGLITPRLGMSPVHSGANTPLRASSEFTPQNLNAAFESPSQEGLALKSDP